MLTRPPVLLLLITRGWGEWVPGIGPKLQPAKSRREARDQKGHSGQVLHEVTLLNNPLTFPCLVLRALGHFCIG